MKYAIVLFDLPLAPKPPEDDKLKNTIARMRNTANSVAGTRMISENCLLIPVENALTQIVTLLHDFQEWHVKYYLLCLDELPSFLSSHP